MDSSSKDTFKHILHSRRPLCPPSIPTGALGNSINTNLYVYHPAYPEYGPMLQFNASDLGGVSYNVVYNSCTAIAGNCWDDNGFCDVEMLPEDGIEDPSSASPSSTDSSSGIKSTLTNILPSKTNKAEKEAKKEAKKKVKVITSTQSPKFPFLSLVSDEEKKPIQIPTNGILKAVAYYFFVPGKEEYAIYPNMYHYHFPKQLPRPWAGLEDHRYSEYPPGGRNNSTRHLEPCRLTGEIHSLEMAHIIPKNHIEWATQEKMIQYATNVNHCGLDSGHYNNTSPIAAQIHGLFDDGVLVPFPKKVKGREHYVPHCHVLKSHGKGFESNLAVVAQYHNRPYDRFYGISPHFLYARFMSSLFQSQVFPILHANTYSSINLLVRKKIPDPKNHYRFDPDEYEEKRMRPGPHECVMPRTGDSKLENTPRQMMRRSRDEDEKGEKGKKRPWTDEDQSSEWEDSSLVDPCDAFEYQGRSEEFDRLTGDEFFLGSDRF
ncbi:uncharacterized protein GGS22DRAFT_174038 [Annulohypoxylon maeteangense]|uniref:uncharacterized protein n=1 Tax=Annulohypoxylon maeteangense TaxID=1927788 RepID=UPI0020088442|nr:uncharacterized protein GGS22DRAFT_174038 [Annulohypoxylon maeteangense]KAI0880718.1 hypothetical protein GGS22DRAFT_174038 [Annulohypoxylon maeteangense]